MTALISAAYDRTALAAVSGAEPGDFLAAIDAMVAGVLAAKSAAEPR